MLEYEHDYIPNIFRVYTVEQKEYDGTPPNRELCAIIGTQLIEMARKMDYTAEELLEFIEKQKELL